MAVIFSILAIVATGAVVYGVVKMGGAEETKIVSETTTVTETGATVTSGTVSCPSDGTTDGRARYEDSLAASTTYDASPTVYFMPMTDGLERVTAGALSASDYGTVVDLKCTKAGTKWQAIAVTTQDDMHSAVGDEFVAEGSYVKETLVGKASDKLRVKVEDKYTGGSKFLNVTGSSDSTAGAWVPLNGTVTVKNFAALTGTSLTIGTDGYIDTIVYVKTNNTKKQFGEDDLKTFILVDADTSDWQEPVMYVDGGSTLVNVIGSMPEADVRKYSGHEYAYEIGPIGDRDTVVGFYMESASGVNPSTDPYIEFCAQGRYNSAKIEDTINVGCWTDGSTQTEVFVSDRQRMKFDVS